ncbi:MAG TPA: hypothetical protein VD970_07820, partial [Acetobacteraceae bacterium]|nr:hypothetical protein [Acetobacteraceae bacterium]
MSATLAPPSRRFDARRALIIAALLAPGIALLAMVLVWPFVVMAELSLRERFPGASPLTLAKYVEFLGDPYLLNVSLRTFLLAATVTAITAV